MMELIVNHPVTYLDILLAFCFILIDVFLSYLFRLGVGSSLVIAAGRCVAQLSLLSLILDSVFDWGNIWAVAAISLWLNIVGAWETVYNKSQQRVIWMFPIVLLALIASSTPICIAGSVAMQRNPIWNPKQYVPVLGLILGSIIATVSLSVSFVLKEFTLYRDRIQTKLAMGASRFEISLPVARSALKLALFPTINDMSMIGLVAIPGTMTGSLLGGIPIDQAAKLQMILMFMIAGACGLSAFLVVILTCMVLIDSDHRVRPERTFYQASIISGSLGLIPSWMSSMRQKIWVRGE